MSVMIGWLRTLTNNDNRGGIHTDHINSRTSNNLLAIIIYKILELVARGLQYKREIIGLILIVT